MLNKKNDSPILTETISHIEMKDLIMETRPPIITKENSTNMLDLKDTVSKLSSQRNIAEITTEIIYHKSQIAQSFIEIGWLLIEAKEQLSDGHGHWLKWLSNSVDISERMAQRYMQLAKAYANTSSVSDLGITKALALMDLPENERETFINEFHKVKGKQKKVSEMSTREIKDAIRGKKATFAKQDDSDILKPRIKVEYKKSINTRRTESSDVTNCILLALKSAQNNLDCILDCLEKQRENPLIYDKYTDDLRSLHEKIRKCIFLMKLKRV